MMGFDPTKDKTLKEKVVAADRDNEVIQLKLVSYNEGPEKIQITRIERDGEMEKFLKLKRLSIAEAMMVRDALTELIDAAGE